MRVGKFQMWLFSRQHPGKMTNKHQPGPSICCVLLSIRAVGRCQAPPLFFFLFFFFFFFLFPLPSGAIHDNAMIQSMSHLLPFTLVEETIVGCDGPLSTDEAFSHFLDSCLSACVCVCLCVSTLMRVNCTSTKAIAVS